MTAAQLGTDIVNAYPSPYSAADWPITQSAINLTQVKKLADSLQTLATDVNTAVAAEAASRCQPP